MRPAGDLPRAAQRKALTSVCRSACWRWRVPLGMYRPAGTHPCTRASTQLAVHMHARAHTHAAVGSTNRRRDDDPKLRDSNPGLACRCSRLSSPCRQTRPLPPRRHADARPPRPRPQHLDAPAPPRLQVQAPRLGRPASCPWRACCRRRTPAARPLSRTCTR